jgi:hypothetical protein
MTPPTDLDKARDAYQRARQRVDETSKTLRAAVIRALQEGMRPGEVARRSGWSAPQVRAIARGAAIGPAKPGRDPGA